MTKQEFKYKVKYCEKSKHYNFELLDYYTKGKIKPRWKKPV